MPKIKLPAWIFDQKSTYFLICINSDGTTTIDGGHSRPENVVKAMQIIESLNCITKQAGRKYVMIRVEDVPDYQGDINWGAIERMNREL